MTDKATAEPIRQAPVQAGEQDLTRNGPWTEWLVRYLRLVAAISMLEGLYHWSAVCGIRTGLDGGFQAQTLPWQAATIFFAIIDLVASVGLWLAAPWGAVVWLTSSVSMIVVQLLFPQVYGVQMALVAAELCLIAIYLVLAFLAAREHAP
jgi:hypothetical protein